MIEPDPAPQEQNLNQLSYATPIRSERGHPLMTLLGFIAAGIFWMVAVLLSAAIFNAILPQVSSNAVPVTAGVILLGIGGTAIVALFLRKHRRFFVLGFLVGTAVMGLLQGLCFISI